MTRTLEQVRAEGLEALRERLGRSDMIRFLQLFETGSGDWSHERHAWVDDTTLDDIRRELSGPREPNDPPTVRP